MHWLTQWWSGIQHMLSGPGHLRFVIQPIVALLLGARDGRLDARAHIRPYLWRQIFDRGDRREAWRSALAGIGKPVLIATIIDCVLQLIILKTIHPLQGLLTGGLLMGVPYAICRALSNRVASRWDVAYVERGRVSAMDADMLHD